MNKPILTSLLLITALGCARASTTFLIDFNDPAGDARPSGYWNEFDDPADIATTDIGTTALKDSENQPSTLSFSKAGTMTNSFSTGTVFDSSEVGPSWVTTDEGSGTQIGAAGDYFFTSTSSGVQSFTLTFTGLTSGDTVSIDLWFSRDSANGNGIYTYSLDDGDTWQGFNVLEKDGTASTAEAATGVNWNTTDTSAHAFRGRTDGYDGLRYMNISSLNIADDGLLLKVADSSALDGKWTALSAARLIVIPEPSSVLLMLGGITLLVTFRPRRA
ncbi:PEP-CTERM sorting domain-containing protein [Kiritimatiellaeota bacterium B1221]|nr:PEP-CTERM sorting domain-containing protein [Kiritimatiellaeota bacterium B1221]